MSGLDRIVSGWIFLYTRTYTLNKISSMANLPLGQNLTSEDPYTN